MLYFVLLWFCCIYNWIIETTKMRFFWKQKYNFFVEFTEYKCNNSADSLFNEIKTISAIIKTSQRF